MTPGDDTIPLADGETVLWDLASWDSPEARSVGQHLWLLGGVAFGGVSAFLAMVASGVVCGLLNHHSCGAVLAVFAVVALACGLLVAGFARPPKWRLTATNRRVLIRKRFILGGDQSIPCERIGRVAAERSRLCPWGRPTSLAIYVKQRMNPAAVLTEVPDVENVARRLHEAVAAARRQAAAPEGLGARSAAGMTLVREVGAGPLPFRRRTVLQMLLAAFGVYGRHFIPFTSISLLVHWVVFPLACMTHLAAYELGPKGALLSIPVVFMLTVVACNVVAASIAPTVAGLYAGHDARADGTRRSELPRSRPVMAASLLLGAIGGVGFPIVLLTVGYVPGVFALTVPVVVLEGRGVRAAMGRGFALLVGGWDGWRASGVVVVLGVLRFLFRVACVVIAVAVVGSHGYALGAGFIAVISLFAFPAYVFFTPIAACLLVMLYVDTRIRREGLDRATLAAELQRSVDQRNWGR